MIKKKKKYVVEFIIDTIVIIMGLLNYIMVGTINENINMVFYIMMIVYGVLYLIEFLAYRKLESLYIMIVSAVCAFGSFFLREYPVNIVLALNIITFTFGVSVVKIMYLKDIYIKKTHLFLIRLIQMSIFLLLGILVSINIFFNISLTGVMVGFLYISYGAMELVCDFLEFLSDNTKFLKE